MKTDIIQKLKEANLKGRGGAGFPTYLKWESVLKNNSSKKYIICNAAEGELDLAKDKYILENYFDEVISGIKIALETIDNSSAYIYLNKKYSSLVDKKIIEGLDITIIEEDTGYIGGEESSAINFIEGKNPEPRKRPPFVSEKGLFDMPTLVNNVETFYYISKINKGEYSNERFYMIVGEKIKGGVYELKDEMSIREILKLTNNYLEIPFYVQVGGGAVGEIMIEKEFDNLVSGEGFIRVISYEEDPYLLMEKWAEFLINGNCDKCTACREGTYRILEMIKTRKLDLKVLEEMFLTLEKTSFCALGKSIPTPFRSLINKVILND
ncbi:MAG: NADH-ubiquinone oxidoreductase-F iron-sulfur binding region domain-containing protein [Candidatus Pacebacteria bacterium]|nr:NADH-ubiquinone oxidoreductase-F iron-sulfur binding region domain-containing protein [Candidatus Paceibacterota bacterium]MDD3919349.1 NADH-ubiquinone oxidoreductase-F iron-sulfur binding region domain-containing protein [Candidatus Paceibacterota bacterium]